MTVNNNPAGNNKKSPVFHVWCCSLLRRRIRTLNSSSLWWTAAVQPNNASSQPFPVRLDTHLTSLSLILGPIGSPGAGGVASEACPDAVRVDQSSHK